MKCKLEENQSKEKRQIKQTSSMKSKLENFKKESNNTYRKSKSQKNWSKLTPIEHKTYTQIEILKYGPIRCNLFLGLV